MDLKDLQRRLNSDEQLRKRFLSDPVGTLEAEGLKLPDQAKTNLSEMVKRLTSAPKPVAGANIAPAGPVGEVSVSVNVGKSF